MSRLRSQALHLGNLCIRSRIASWQISHISAGVFLSAVPSRLIVMS
jgi:hypothetical protein